MDLVVLPQKHLIIYCLWLDSMLYILVLLKSIHKENAKSHKIRDALARSHKYVAYHIHKTYISYSFIIYNKI